MYVLPFSESEALVEYTLFSKELLPMEKYEEALTSYLTKDLCCPPFQIINSERGSIPMTCYNFHENHSANMHYIGTAGGWAKPSTGYTFMSSAKKVPELINALKSGKALRRLSFKNRFWYYDLLLLDVLAQDNDKGNAVFESLFEKRNPQLIFKFLDEQTDIIEELKFISACPINPFVKALLARLF
jgi:lycopene beta-cyclase